MRRAREKLMLHFLFLFALDFFFNFFYFLISFKEEEGKKDYSQKTTVQQRQNNIVVAFPHHKHELAVFMQKLLEPQQWANGSALQIKIS